MLGMDVKEFSGPTIQRVYQYLRRHATGQNLDIFLYCDEKVEGSEKDFLEVVLRYVANIHTAYTHQYKCTHSHAHSKCGIHDPSWSEIYYFTKFLNVQLRSCESSVFLDESIVRDSMSGLKSFVVKFMIRMSQVSRLFPVFILLRCI